jgi:RNA polymerase sigma factor (sigma-70 family)
LWERWDRVSAMDDPEGYLNRTAMKAFRSRARRASLALRHIARLRPVDDASAGVERREMLVQALASLTPRERAAVVLTDVLGYSSEEAGRWLRIKPVTVRVLASRGRGRLRQEVSDDD